MAFSLMFLGAASGQIYDYWMTTLGGSGAEEGNSVVADSGGNSYTFGFTAASGAGSTDFLLVKNDPNGKILWERTLGGSSDEQGYSVAIDSSDNLYVIGRTNSAGAGSFDFLFAKYNSSGVIQWQRTLGSSGLEIGHAITVDTSNNVYVTGYTSSSGAGSYDLVLAKYNSSGTIQWQRTLGGSLVEEGRALTTDSSGNVYVLGHTSSVGGGNYDMFLVKYDSSGTVQWQRVIGEDGFDSPGGVVTDSSGNVYLVGYSPDAGVAGSENLFLAKYDSSGTVQWFRQLGGTGTDRGSQISIRGSFLYVIGWTDSTGSGNFDYLMAKYNFNGSIQWQRSLGGSGSDRGQSIATDSSGNVFAFGHSQSAGAGNYDMLLMKVPDDGSLTGTYVLDGANMVYAASSLTVSADAITHGTASLTSATPSMTTATPTLTDASASLTKHLAGIG
jgi:uncharacterized delta-60 repeat protein